MKSPYTFLALCLFPLLTLPAHAVELPDACGNSQSQFTVKTVKASSRPPAPVDGKAQIIFLEDENQDVAPFSGATVRFGLDGTWAGATKGSSYFVATIDPGIHHLCANWQSSFKRLEKNADAISLTAEAGKTYYFSAAVTVESKETVTFAFSQLNEDQGKYRVKLDKLSTFRAK